MFSTLDIQALWLTLELSLYTTIILLVVGTPLAWLLAHSKSRWWSIVDSLVSLPLVLPPTVLGFYLLIAFSPVNGFGAWWKELTGSTLAFSFTGILIASVIYSLPFVVQPLQSGFKQMGTLYTQTAASLGANRWQRFLRIILPMNRRLILAAASLGFAHTMGEFGVVLMVGGSIPEQTQVLSIALFEHVEAGETLQAHWLAGLLLLISLSLLLLINFLQRHGDRRNSNA